MSKNQNRRSGSVATTAEAGQVSGKVACTHILPKVFEWTEARSEYRRAYHAFRMSKRLIHIWERYTLKHWYVYEDLCFEWMINPNYARKVWKAAGGKHEA